MFSSSAGNESLLEPSGPSTQDTGKAIEHSKKLKIIQRIVFHQDPHNQKRGADQERWMDQTTPIRAETDKTRKKERDL